MENSMTQVWSVICHMGSHITHATRHKWTHPAFTPAKQAGTRFTDHLRMEGSVNPGPGCKEQLAHGDMVGEVGYMYLAYHITPVSEVASFFVCVLQTNTSLSYLVVDSTHTAVELFHAGLTLWNGTHYLMNSDIRHVILTVLNSFLRQSCIVSTSVNSALQVFFNAMCQINVRFTYLLWGTILLFLIELEELRETVWQIVLSLSKLSLWTEQF